MPPRNEVDTGSNFARPEREPTSSGCPSASGQVFCCEIICRIFEGRKANDGNRQVS